MTIGLVLFAGYSVLATQLPDLDALNDIHYQSPMRVYSRDGLLIGEFGEKIRYPVTLDEVPKPMIQAFLSAEDDRFFEHPGFDYQGLLRASLTYVITGEKRQGGSTITMQVARNFFLSNEKTFLRKIKEIMLAMKIERNCRRRESSSSISTRFISATMPMGSRQRLRSTTTNHSKRLIWLKLP